MRAAYGQSAAFGCPAGFTQSIALRNGQPSQGIHRQALELRALH
jgi:hypothetical protein